MDSTEWVNEFIAGKILNKGVAEHDICFQKTLPYIYIPFTKI